MKTHEQYVRHLLRTKHQADYHKFVLDNLQPGEAVIIVDYRRKLELGVRSHEAQRDWYGKRGISLHGLLVIAQISEDKKVTEVIDLWSEDTKQDAWFSQSAMDVGFQWMEKELPGFRVYLFSGEHNCLFVEFSGPFKVGWEYVVLQKANNSFSANKSYSVITRDYCTMDQLNHLILVLMQC